MKNKKNVLNIVLIFFILSLFFRIDFRFKNSVECCSDDYDYFSHAETIALDGDFDYSNQLTTDHPYTYSKDNKIAPVGFPGSGMLSSPFLYVGNLIDNNLNSENGKEILNYKLLFYSLSSIFYFFMGYIFIFKSLVELNLRIKKYQLLLIYSGSGVTYFAFERFSMTHAFEVFTISLLIYQSTNFFKNKSKWSAIFIPLILTISFFVKMSNYFIFLIPLITKFLVVEKFDVKNNLTKNFYFILSTLFSSGLYAVISTNIYGKIMFNPQEVYSSNIKLNDVIGQNNYFEVVADLFNVFILILFGNEFGIFWVSPIIFSGIFLTLYDYKKLFKLKNILTLVCFAQCFGIVYLWKSTGASYGFRYLYALVPLSILVLYSKNSKLPRFFNLIVLLSIFSNLAILFFETTEQTQLAMNEQVNSFGVMANYAEVNYVTGVIKSFFSLNSYLIIFSTSFVGVLFFKLLITIFDVSYIFDVLQSLGLPTDNSDFIKYIENLSLISVSKIFTISLFLLLFSIYIVAFIDKGTKRK